MHCVKKPNADVACYVTNYGTGYSNAFPGLGTDDQDDANAAGARNTVGQCRNVSIKPLVMLVIFTDLESFAIVPPDIESWSISAKAKSPISAGTRSVM